MALGTCRVVLELGENVAQSYLVLPRTQQTSDVPGMEVLKHMDVTMTHGHTYSYGDSGTGHT